MRISWEIAARKRFWLSTERSSAASAERLSSMSRALTSVSGAPVTGSSTVLASIPCQRAPPTVARGTSAE